jgi:hypothetical protein
VGNAIKKDRWTINQDSATAAATSTSAVFGWCAYSGELSNPFSLFSLFTLIPYFFFFLLFPALRRVDFFEKMALMLNFIKAMKELSVISWEGGVILWVVKLLKKLVSLLLE